MSRIKFHDDQEFMISSCRIYWVALHHVLSDVKQQLLQRQRFSIKKQEQFMSFPLLKILDSNSTPTISTADRNDY